MDEAPTFFLGFTKGPDKAGVFCLHGRIPIFPEDYTRGPEEVSALLCGRDHTYTQIVTEGAEEAGAPVTVNAAPSFQKPQLMS